MSDEKFPDPLVLLAREDKWYLGGAPALLYAPPTPQWEIAPGFWDEAHFLHFLVQPIFTFALIDDSGHAIELQPTGHRWQPHRRVKRFTGDGVAVEESQCCGPHDVLADIVRVRNTGDQGLRLRLVAWTTQLVSDASFHDAGEESGAVVVSRDFVGLRDTKLALSLALDLEGARSWSVDLSETCAIQPHWFITPYTETLQASGLPNRATLTGVNRDGVVFAALERPLELAPGQTVESVIRAAVAPSRAEAVATLLGQRGTDPLALSEAAWREYFDQVPRFKSSDPYLEASYYYRWYGLRLNAVSRRLGNYRHPAVMEGIGYFRVPISYSAQCHMLETRWLRDPALAQGSLLNFIDNQRDDGSLPNHIHVNYVAPEGIYHADWGARVLDLHRVHPDEALLERAYDSLNAYLNFFYSQRDPQGSGLYDHVNQWESGQEYMSRYVWVDEEGDHWKAMARRLKGLDASVYVYRCERALAEISAILGKGAEAAWDAKARRTREAILRHCWREDLQAFVDVSPDLEPSSLVFATSFYPFFTDLVGKEHLPSLRRYLLNPDEFWTPFPVPASPKSDPYYSAEPTWRGKRTNCPWNGRTWPMTNSHVAEALAVSSALDPSLRPVAAEFIQRFVRMMFFDDDPGRPNSFEHYNPETGHPSRYRGFDDYMHSWIVDLIIKYVGGIQPQADSVVVDPFPFESNFALEGVHVRGHIIDVSSGSDGFVVRLDGAEVHRGPEPQAVTLTLEDRWNA